LDFVADAEEAFAADERFSSKKHRKRISAIAVLEEGEEA
jgi:hypothetical protein